MEALWRYAYVLKPTTKHEVRMADCRMGQRVDDETQMQPQVVFDRCSDRHQHSQHHRPVFLLVEVLSYRNLAV